MPHTLELKPPSTAENPNAFKHAINKNLLTKMAKAIHEASVDFQKNKLISIAPQLDSLELKARVYLVRDELKKGLPQNYPAALKVLMNSLKNGELRGFDLWPYTEYIQTYGLEHLDLSLKAMRAITHRFSSEFAVRPFITKYPQETLKYLIECARDKDVHVRRWASEGSRPRLPWGERLKALIADPQPNFAILDQLKFDDELYVRKSVANHINDISKDHPEIAIAWLKLWQKEALKKENIKHQEKIDWIVRHALRGLIKAGNPKALKLIGAKQDIKIQVKSLKLEKTKIKLNDSLPFEFTIQSRATKSQKLVIDYIIHYKKSNQGTSPKVFKLKTFELSKNESITIKKNHPVRKITTRQHHAGVHFIEIQVNGKVYAKSSWKLSL